MTVIISQMLTKPKGGIELQAAPGESGTVAAPSLDTCEQVVAAWSKLSIEEQRKRNFARLDELVIPFGEFIGSEKQARGGHKLIFMHIPKSGGTTLEYLIAKNYMINGVLHINAPALEKNPKAVFKKGVFPRVVMGHHKLNQPLYQLADSPFAHITMLREPVGRILSYYNYLQTSPNHQQHTLAAGMSLAEFVDSNKMVELHNAQTLRIAGLLKKRIIKKRPNDPATLELAQHNLEKRFTLFGLTDQYAAFLIMTRRLLGWADVFYERRNVSKRTTEKTEIDESIVRVIRDRNALDIELYEFATGLFNERCRTMGITADTVEEYNRCNAAYQEVYRATL